VKVEGKKFPTVIVCLNEEMTQGNRQLYQDYGTATFRQISLQVNNQGGKMVQDLGYLSCGIIQMPL
jgi:hypothetical protein